MTPEYLNKITVPSGRLRTVLSNSPWENLADIRQAFLLDANRATDEFLRIPGAGRRTLGQLTDWLSLKEAHQDHIVRLSLEERQYIDSLCRKERGGMYSDKNRSILSSIIEKMDVDPERPSS